MASRNEEIVRKWIDEGFSRGKVELADELLADDIVNHTAQPGQGPGRDGVKKAVLALRSAFPDLQIRIADVVAQGDTVAVRDEITGTHSAVYNGVQPTGRKVTVGRLSFYKLKDGRIAEHWSQLDMAVLMRQLTSPAA
jgi:steroid delta-isomerase-like uncharacterized protein